MSNKVGAEVLSFCGSCKMDLSHTIMALNGTKIQKCQCRTCKATHGYRTPKGITDPGKYKEAVEKSKSATAGVSKTGKTRKAKEIISHDIHWEKIMDEHKNTPSVPYSAKTPFKSGVVIHHPVFGDGLVEKLIHPNKIEVVFKMESKVLIHGGSETQYLGPKPPPSK